jgi:hypothetical protein
MNALTVTAAVTAGLAVGYLLGRIRPWDRLDTFVWRQFAFGGPWTRTKPRQAVIAVLHALVRPLVTLSILRQMWRERGQPPKPTRSPAVRVTGPRIPDHRVDEEA